MIYIVKIIVGVHMRIIIDGDAIKCDIIENVAKEFGIECLIFIDLSHENVSSYSTIYKCDTCSQSVDMKIFSNVCEGDLVITNDYGLASLCLDKAFVISSKGYEYTKENIDFLLINRYLNMKAVRKKGPKKRIVSDDINLVTKLEEVIRRSLC